VSLQPTPAADLFADVPLPHGLVYRPEYLSRGDEAEFLALLERLPFVEARFQQYTARRRVVRFGELYDEATGAWSSGPEVPTAIAALRDRVAQSLGLAPDAFVHVLATEYRPGTPIGWHRDKAHYGLVAGISLAGACRMRFRPLDARDDRSAGVALDLAPRSLYVMRDEIRWHWQHHIPPTKALRYSITLRTRNDAGVPLPARRPRPSER